MSSSADRQVIIVGGGIAGLTAACRLAELGVRAAVLEKGEGDYLCNSRFTGGFFHICFRNIMSDAGFLADLIRSTVRELPSPALAQVVAEDGRRAVRWLQSQGIRFMKGGADEWQQWMLAPPSLVRPGLNWRGRGGDVTLRTLRAHLLARGGALHERTAAVELVIRNGACAGVIAEVDGRRAEFAATAVVLADGGFQGDLEMMRHYISPRPERLRQRGAGTGCGDGIRMAQEAGARLVGLNFCYGHVLHRDAMTNPNLWPYPVIDYVAAAGIVVDGSGRRFTDEGLGGIAVTNGIARLADPLSSFAILDEAIWNGPARDFILAANPNLPAAGGALASAGDLAGLAAATGLPTAALAETVAAFNRAVDEGATERLEPPRTAAKYRPWPIRVAPFHAIPLAAGITYTMGGIAIDAASRVLDGEDRPIPGLYAAGCTTGGLEGGTNAGYVGGLAKSTVSALRAAEAIAGASA